ncbi:MAG: hypothetical protein GXO83_02590 [Chlorobi bacterium]|nr:hypothetical protein [Chlorobiota bacterium]
MSQQKMRVIRDYDKLDKAIQEQIKLVYPEGFSQHLITFLNKDGKYVSALPFETDEKYYLVRMTEAEADLIISEDDDYNDAGNLKDKVKEEFVDKYAELEYLSENMPDDGEPEDEED